MASRPVCGRLPVDHLTAPIFLLTDFGLRDSYVGQVKAVISALAPASPLIDITHEIEPYAIDEAAWTLEACLPALPVPATVLAVVDPGVGTARRAVAVHSAGRWFIGPDNGVLSAAVAVRPPGDCLAGPHGVDISDSGVDVCELGSPGFHRHPVSATFHGRDVFAPAAARLAAGLDSRQLGPPCSSLTLLPRFGGVPDGPGCLRGYVVHVDRYGNVVTSIRAEQLFTAFVIEVGGTPVDVRGRTFADGPADRPFCHVDSSGFVVIALREGHAAAALGAQRRDPVTVRAR